MSKRNDRTIWCDHNGCGEIFPTISGNEKTFKQLQREATLNGWSMGTVRDYCPKHSKPPAGGGDLAA